MEAHCGNENILVFVNISMFVSARMIGDHYHKTQPNILALGEHVGEVSGIRCVIFKKV